MCLFQSFSDVVLLTFKTSFQLLDSFKQNGEAANVTLHQKVGGQKSSAEVDPLILRLFVCFFLSNSPPDLVRNREGLHGRLPGEELQQERALRTG